MSVVRLNVPRLLAEPAIGSGCCVVLAGDLIKGGLMGLCGVQAVSVEEEEEAGLVTVTYDPCCTDMQAISLALADIGYRVRDAE